MCLNKNRKQKLKVKKISGDLPSELCSQTKLQDPILHPRSLQKSQIHYYPDR